MIRGTVPKIKDVNTDQARSGQSLNCLTRRPVTHLSPCSATTRTFAGGYAAYPEIPKEKRGVFQLSIGFWLSNWQDVKESETIAFYRKAGCKVSIPEISDVIPARGITGRQFLSALHHSAALDHLCTYSSHNFWCSVKLQGQWGLSIRPMAKSLHWC